MNATTITLAGNLVADAELRYTATGVPVASFRVASTERIKTDQDQEYSPVRRPVRAGEGNVMSELRKSAQA